MKTDAPPIAMAELVRVCANGDRVPIVVEIGQPYQTSEGSWRTPVALHGLDGRSPDIYGDDSLQSLCLAVRLVRQRLSSIIEDGDRLLDPAGDEFPFAAYFPAHRMLDMQ